MKEDVDHKKALGSKKWMIPFCGLALLFLLLLGSVVLVSHPTVWEKVHRSAMKESLHEGHYENANKITGGLWTTEPYEEISQGLKRYRMNEKEIAHYEDVRSLLGAARIVIVVCAVIVLLGCMIVGWKKIWLSGFAVFVLLGVIAGVWMMIHWHSLFKALHWAIFWDDSWKLPNKSYSLGLFPHKVWQLAGGAIAGMVCIPLVFPVIGVTIARLRKKDST